MKKLVIMMLLLTLCLSGCVFFSDSVVGNGRSITTDYSFKGFSQISSNYNFYVTIEQSDEYSIEITCDENIVKYLKVNKIGGKLTISLKESNNYRNLKLKAHIKAPMISKITANGSSEVILLNELNSGTELFVDLNGSSTLRGSINVNNIDIKLNGSSDMTSLVIAETVVNTINGGSRLNLEGTTNQLQCNAEGGSKVKMYNLTVNSATVDLSGSSTAELSINETINLNASGASKLYYKGDAIIENIELSGESKIIHK